MEKGNRKAIIFISILIVLFLCDAFKFIEAGGPIVQMTLFNMIFLLAIIILIIHKNDLYKKTQMIQKNRRLFLINLVYLNIN